MNAMKNAIIPATPATRLAVVSFLSIAAFHEAYGHVGVCRHVPPRNVPDRPDR